MKKRLITGVIGFFTGMTVASVLLIDFSDVSLGNNFTQYVVISSSILGIIGILLAIWLRLRESWRIWIAKIVLIFSILLLSMGLFCTIFSFENFEVHYGTLLSSALMIVAMILLIRTAKKAKQTAK